MLKKRKLIHDTWGFNMTGEEVSQQASSAKGEMGITLKEIKTLRDEVKGRLAKGFKVYLLL